MRFRSLEAKVAPHKGSRIRLGLRNKLHSLSWVLREKGSYAARNDIDYQNERIRSAERPTSHWTKAHSPPFESRMILTSLMDA